MYRRLLPRELPKSAIHSLTGCQLRTKSSQDKIISDKMDIFYLFPAIFLLCPIFRLTVYVNFTRLILTKETGVDNKILLLFFSGLIGVGGDVIFLLPQLLLSAAMSIVSGRVYESIQQ
jgi:type III secretory pathway component EscV